MASSSSPASGAATPTVFVAGATGNIGGAVARELRQNLGWAVQTTARNLESPQAKALATLGVRLLPGDWDDVAAMTAAMAGCDKLFLCPATYVEDPGREGVHAANLVRAARAAGSVRQVVLSTSAGVSTHRDHDRGHHSTFFDKVMTAKKAAERAVAAASTTSTSSTNDGQAEPWRWTALRPAVFMTNFFAPQVDYFSPGFRASGVWRSTMTAESLLALVVPADIAKIAAAVLRQPDRYHGRAIGVASDLLTVRDALAQLGDKTGRAYAPYFMTEQEIDEQRESLCFTIAERSLRQMADDIDMAELRSMAPMTSFREFLDREEKTILETYRKA